jgi:hypothetical protein
LGVQLVFFLDIFCTSGTIFGNKSLQKRQLTKYNSDKIGTSELAYFLQYYMCRKRLDLASHSVDARKNKGD